jgi:hypothetical protein
VTHVLAQALGEVRGVGHRLDAGGVDRLHLLDQAEDAVELFAGLLAASAGKVRCGRGGR